MDTHPAPLRQGALFIGSAVSLYRSKFTDCLAGAVSVNRYNLDLLCNNDCGAWGQLWS
jgi:hypothetical protein